MTATRYWSQSLITAYSTTTTGFGGEVCVVLASDYDALAAKLAEAERDAQRWRNARRTANDISNPTLRGIVTTFLDRFGITAGPAAAANPSELCAEPHIGKEGRETGVQALQTAAVTAPFGIVLDATHAKESDVPLILGYLVSVLPDGAIRKELDELRSRLARPPCRCENPVRSSPRDGRPPWCYRCGGYLVTD